MVDLPFFEDDGTMSLKDLFALRGNVRTDSIVMAIEGRLLGRRDGSAESEAEHITIVVEDLEREVNNGGFAQFFTNSPEYVRFAVPYLDKIGCPNTADIARRAIEQLAVEDISDIDAIAAKAEEFDGEDLDQEFFAYPDPIDERLLDYIQLHPEDFAIDPISIPPVLPPDPPPTSAFERLRRRIFGS